MFTTRGSQHHEASNRNTHYHGNATTPAEGEREEKGRAEFGTVSFLLPGTTKPVFAACRR